MNYVMTLCRSTECGNDITEDESEESPGYCTYCGETVWAFCPNGDVDEWFAFYDGQPASAWSVQGDQCGECGHNNYSASWNGDNRLTPDVGCVQCGSDKSVRLMPAYSVIF